MTASQLPTRGEVRSAVTDKPETVPSRGRRKAVRGTQGRAGWLFVSPALVILVLFLVIPILLALYISFTRWTGFTTLFASNGPKWVGLSNYRQLLTTNGLTRLTFATAVRNNFWFVVFTVPLQTALSLGLAVLVNDRFLKGKSFFRTAFYFPSVTGSIAISLVFLFLFQGNGAINKILSTFGITGPNWLISTNGVFWNILSVFGVNPNNPPGWATHTFWGIRWWDWLAGPSVGMCVVIILIVWTTSGTYMLMFLAALQNVSEEVEEATLIDGATSWQRFRLVTVPMLRPTVVLVLTLGMMGTWQVFDQITIFGPNNPSIATPAYQSYAQSFNNFSFGIGAAMAFLLFLLIVVLTYLQRKLIPEDIT
ncbi:MAG: sugar ABC transporter permease [Acidimicrobiaceae bacterium]|nr:sugar ABC transporter permease [Acidimicrobiaceae bacterium]